MAGINNQAIVGNIIGISAAMKTQLAGVASSAQHR
jgi:hypothetical protein